MLDTVDSVEECCCARHSGLFLKRNRFLSPGLFFFLLIFFKKGGMVSIARAHSIGAEGEGGLSIAHRQPAVETGDGGSRDECKTFEHEGSEAGRLLLSGRACGAGRISGSTRRAVCELVT